MDLDEARKKIQLAADIYPLSDILIDVLRVLGDMDDTIGQLRLRIQDLERSASPVKE